MLFCYFLIPTFNYLSPANFKVTTTCSLGRMAYAAILPSELAQGNVNFQRPGTAGFGPQRFNLAVQALGTG